MMPTQHVLIATGGTGGHVYPALAVAEELQRRGIKVSWMGTRNGMESKIVPSKSIPLHYVSVTGLRGKGLIGWLQAPFKVTIAVYQALSILIKQKPNVVLGMGGFVSGPGGIASWILRKPLVIHEQNTIAGMTNKMLSHFATHVVQAFPNTFKKNINAIHAGNPIRKDIENMDSPKIRFNSRQNKEINVLVLGGSLGATALNESLPKLFKNIGSTCPLNIIHQSGTRNFDLTQSFYKKVPMKSEVIAYVDDMPKLYSWADIVICRSGALTVSELSVAGVGSILIPYPYAVDDHQYFNARYLADGDAAIVVRQSNLKSDDFKSTLEKLLCNGRDRLLSMAENARGLAMQGAATQVADLCCNLMLKPEQGISNG